MASMNYTKLWSVMTVMVVFSCVLVQSDKIPIFSTSPTDTIAAVGHSVTIYCSIANRGNYQVFWNIVKNARGDAIPEEFTLGPFTNEHASYARFQIVGDVIGEYNLRISNVSKEDAGRYVCLVHDPSDGMASAIESGVSLTVLDSDVAPGISYPKCQRDPLGNSVLMPGQYIKGDILELTCTSKGGVPLAELSWEVVYLNGFKERLLSKTLVIGDVVMTTTSLELTSLHHQSYFKCTEEHPSTAVPRTCKTPFTGSESLLDVLYTPEVDMTPNVVNVMILDTVKVTMSCTAHANPPIFRRPAIMLPVNKSAVYPLGELDQSLVEVELTVDDVGKSFYCRAENEDGIGEDTMDVLKSTSIPTWLVLVIIGSIAAVIFIFIILVSCILCVDRSKYDDATRSSNSSRPTSMKKEDDGFDNMIPIEEFQGGQESSHVNPDKTATNDYETGETASPRYQNVNGAFEGDEIVPHSPEPDADFVPVDLS